MPQRLTVEKHGSSPESCDSEHDAIEQGIHPAAWLKARNKLVQDRYSDHMVVQMRDEDDDNWLISEKGLANGKFGPDLVHINPDQETEKAVKIGKYEMITEDGWTMAEPIADIWIPKSQIIIFRMQNYG